MKPKPSASSSSRTGFPSPSRSIELEVAEILRHLRASCTAAVRPFAAREVTQLVALMTGMNSCVSHSFM
jgi:hypothetical protein